MGSKHTRMSMDASNDFGGVPKRLLAATLQAIALCALLLLSTPSLAEKHALLVGVGKYKAPFAQLKGPTHDITSLKEALIANWDFKPENIQTLVNQQATKDAILSKMRALDGKTRPGDLVFVYFSGHGSSSNDAGFKGLAARIAPTTGALLPSDATKGTPREMYARLIIGKRDLVPILKTLDNGRVVLAVFDACYSGVTVRRLLQPDDAPVSRYAAAATYQSPEPSPPASGADGESQEPYPYTNVVYISASAQMEVAQDLPARMTHDGKPHGALTDALLVGLTGAADTNRDGVVTPRELHSYAQRQVYQHNQTPQLLFSASNESLLDQPVLGRGRFVSAPTAATDSRLVVLCKGRGEEMAQTVESMRGVRLVRSGEAFDLAVDRDADGMLLLYAQNGHILTEVAGKSVDAKNAAQMLRERLQKQVNIKRLQAITGRRTGSNVFLTVLGPDGVLPEGTSLGFKVKFEKPSHVLLLNISPGGNVNVLYPYNQSELAQQPADKELRVPPSKVTEPFGVETLAVYAFDRKPEGIEQFVGVEELSATDRRFEDLARLLDGSKDSFASHWLQVKTSPKRDIAGRQ